MATPRTPDPDANAEARFAEFLMLLDEGGEPDFDGWLAEQPEATHDALHRLHSDWKRWGAALVGAAPGPVSSATPTGKEGQGEISSSELIQGLGLAPRGDGRYRFRSLVARGGQGAVLKVWDNELRRPLAMKVVLGKGEEAQTGDTPQLDERSLARFLDEAQITGQLDHPGIVPVHELGVDPTGRAWFTMQLVKGQSFHEVIDAVHRGAEEWTLVRAMGVLLKVCEAIAYAHTRGVVHRDLKPSNVMVGRFGEVYVMDWGLARVLGETDRKDLRITAKPPSASSVRTVRRDTRDDDPDSPLFTMDGDVVGTPAYMPPEQARGELDQVGPRADVYAVGAMLYHLLAGHMPYVAPGTKASNYAVWRWVQEGAPEALERRAPDAPAELVAICDKAMARDQELRFDSIAALESELRAYSEGRVVRAYETGAVAELRKWVKRNRSQAFLGAAAVLAIVVGSTAVAFLERSRRQTVFETERDVNAALQKRDDALIEADEARGRIYRSSVRAASHAAAAGDWKSAQLLLEQCDPDLRGWEYDHLMLQVKPWRHLLQHGDKVTAVSFDASGERLLTASWDGHARVWDPRDGTLVHDREAGPDAQVLCAEFSPDGRWFAFGASDRSVTVCDAVSGEVVHTLTDRPQGAVGTIAFHPSSRWLVAGSDGCLVVWGVTTGRAHSIADLERAHEVWDVGFDADGAHVIAYASSKETYAWNWSAGGDAELLGEPSSSFWSGRYVGPSYFATFDSVVVRGVESSIEAIDLRKGDVVWSVPSGLGDPLCVAGSSDGQVVIAAEFQGNGVLVLDARDGSERFRWNIPKRRIGGFPLGFDPTNSWIALADSSIHLLDATSGDVRMTLSGHTASVTTLAFSPDGSLLASGSDDDSVRLWDMPFAQARAVIDHVPSVSIAIAPDGARIATANIHGDVRFHDTSRLLELARYDLPPTGVTGNVWPIEFDPGGDWAAIWAAQRLGEENGSSIGLVNTAGELERVLGLPYVSSWLISPDSRWVAWQESEPTIHRAYLHDRETGQMRTLAEWDSSEPGKMYMDETGTKLVVIAANTPARIHTLGSNSLVPATIPLVLTDPPKSCAYSAVSGWLAVGSADGKLLTTAVDELGSPRQFTFESPVCSMDFDSAGQKLLVCTEGGAAVMLDLEAATVVWTRSSEEKHDDIRFGPGDRTVFATCGTGAVALAVDSGEALGTLVSSGNRIDAMAVGARKYIATATEGEGIVVADMRTLNRLTEFDVGVQGGQPSVYGLAFSPDESTLHAETSDGLVTWDLSSAIRVGYLEGGELPVVGNPDGWFAVVRGGGFDMVELTSGRSVFSREGTPEHGFLKAIAVDPSGRRVVASTFPPPIRLWDVDSGDLLASYDLGQGVMSMGFRADGNLLAAGRSDGAVLILDLQTEEIRRLGGHTDGVRSVDFDPSGARLVSASADKTIRVWDVEDGSFIEREEHSDGLKSARFSPDGRRVLSLGHDDTLRLWDVDSFEVIAVLPAERAVSVRFSPDGRRIFGVSWNKLLIWESDREAALQRARTLAETAKTREDR